MDPEALLLDEPTSALDPERKAEVIALLRSFAKDGTTLVLVCHDPPLVRDLCDRVVVLRIGRVVADGAPGQVLTEAR
jgi:ABC-type glutathione transport system ATPase component